MPSSSSCGLRFDMRWSVMTPMPIMSNSRKGRRKGKEDLSSQAYLRSWYKLSEGLVSVPVGVGRTGR